MSTTAPLWSTATSSSRSPSEVSERFRDSKATIADNNFALAKRKVICTRGGLQRAARRGSRTRGSGARQVVGPEETADILSWSDNARTKRRINCWDIPGVYAEPYDLSCPLPFLKASITDELVENFGSLIIISISIIIIISPFQRNKIQTLLFKLFDKLIRLELVEDLQTLSSFPSQWFKQEINVNLSTNESLEPV